MDNQEIIWPYLLKIAVNRLGISPANFWNMTIKEFNILLTDINKNDDFITQSQLRMLQELFPDKNT